MYRPQNRFHVPAFNRHHRRAAKSVLRSNRHDQRWMAQYHERQERAKRWKSAFGFLPLNFLRFASLLAAFVSSLNDSLDSLLSANRSPGAAHLNRAGEMRWGKGGKSKKRRKSSRGRAKQNTSTSYESLEPRQLLAGDISYSWSGSFEDSVGEGQDFSFTAVVAEDNTDSDPTTEVASFEANVQLTIDDMVIETTGPGSITFFDDMSTSTASAKIVEAEDTEDLVLLSVEAQINGVVQTFETGVFLSSDAFGFSEGEEVPPVFQSETTRNSFVGTTDTEGNNVNETQTTSGSPVIGTMDGAVDPTVLEISPEIFEEGNGHVIVVLDPADGEVPARYRFLDLDGEQLDAVNAGEFVTLNFTGRDEATDTLEIQVDDLADGTTVNYNGGVGGNDENDTLILSSREAATPPVYQSVAHRFTNASDGQVDINGGSVVVNYVGLEPMIDNLASVDRTFNFTGEGETIVLTATGATNDLFIDSDFSESVDFVAPTNSLTINSLNGSDTIDIAGDVAGALPVEVDVIINSSNQADIVTLAASTEDYPGNVTITGGRGNDAITVNSLGLTYAGTLTINGGNNVDSINVNDITGSGNVVVQGSSVADTINLNNINTSGTVSVEGGGGGDAINLNNVFATGTVSVEGSNGSDAITGSSGNEIAVYVSPRPEYEIVSETDGKGRVTAFSSVSDIITISVDDMVINPNEGTDTLTGIKVLQFSDVVLDLNQGVQQFNSSDELIGTFDTIQEAIVASSPGETIRVFSAFRMENVTIPSGSDITLELEGTVQGNFSGEDDGSTVVAIGDVTIGEGGSSAGFAHVGTLLTGANKVTLKDSGTANLGAQTTVADGGELEADNAVRLSTNDILTGDGLVDGDVELQTGTVAGNLTIDGLLNGAIGATAAGFVSAGNSPGVITANDLSLSSGDTFTVEIDGTAGPGVMNGHDLTIVDGGDGDDGGTGVDGTVTLGGAMLVLTSATPISVPVGTEITIIQNDNSEAVVDIFDGLPGGTVVETGNQLFEISYTGGVNGNDVTLTARSKALIEFQAAGSSESEDVSGATMPTGNGPTLVVNGDLTGTSDEQRTVRFATPLGTVAGPSNAATIDAPASNADVATTSLEFIIPEGNYTTADLGLGEFNLIEEGLIVIVDDGLVEGPEDFEIQNLTFVGPGLLRGDANGGGENVGTQHTIVDNEAAIWTLAADTTSITEDQAATPTVEFTFGLFAPEITGAPSTVAADFQAGENATIQIDLSTSSATSVDDHDFIASLTAAVSDYNSAAAAGDGQLAFDAVTGIITFTALADGDSFEDFSFDVTAVEDSLIEGPEDIQVSLSLPTSAGTSAALVPGSDTGAAIALDPALDTGVTVTITDNDFAEWNLTQAVGTDVDEGDSQTYTFSLTGDGSGTGPFLFQAGETATVEVQVDTLDETTIGNDFPSPVQAIFDAVADWNTNAALGNNGANGVLTATFDATIADAPVVLTYEAGDAAGAMAGDPRTGEPTAMPSLDVVVMATDDSDIEGDEDVEISIANAGSTTGADVRLDGDPGDGSVVPEIAVTTTINDNDFAEWNLTQAVGADVDEGDSQTYTFSLTGDGSGTGPFLFQAGETATVEVQVDTLDETTIGDDFPSPVQAIFDAVADWNADAALGNSGANGVLTATFDATIADAPVVLTYEAGDAAGAMAGDPRTGEPTAMPSLDVVVMATDDSDIEGDEDVEISIANAGSTTGADVRLDGDPGDGSVVPEIAVTTTINDNDTAVFALTQTSNQEANGVDEGDSAVYTLTVNGIGSSGAVTSVVVNDGTADTTLEAGTTTGSDYSTTGRPAAIQSFVSGGITFNSFIAPDGFEGTTDGVLAQIGTTAFPTDSQAVSDLDLSTGTLNTFEPGNTTFTNRFVNFTSQQTAGTITSDTVFFAFFNETGSGVTLVDKNGADITNELTFTDIGGEAQLIDFEFERSNGNAITNDREVFGNTFVVSDFTFNAGFGVADVAGFRGTSISSDVNDGGIAIAESAVQAGDTATVDLALAFGGTVAEDFDETLGAAVIDAVDAFNATIVTGGAVAGTNGTFSYSAGTLTFTGDGVQTAPSLNIDLDTFDDSLIEGDESFSIALSNVGGTVATQLLTAVPSAISTTINDNDFAEWNLTQAMGQEVDGVDEGASATYTFSLVGDGSGTAPFLFQAGETATVDVQVDAMDTTIGDDYPSPVQAIFDAVAFWNSAAGPGNNGANGVLTATFDNMATNAPVVLTYEAGDMAGVNAGDPRTGNPTAMPSLDVVLQATDDSDIEGPEDVSILIENAGSTTGADVRLDGDTMAMPVTDITVTTTINDNDFAEWNLVQGPMDDVDEGDSQTYTFSLTGDGSGTGPFLFQAGETATVDVQVDAMDTTIGDDYPSPVQAIFDAVAFWNSAAGPGNNGANGVLTATFDNMAMNAPVVLTYEAGDMAGVNAGDPRTGNPTAMPSLDVVLQATDDSDIEGPEDVSILIENAGSTTGADVRLDGDTMAMPVTDITVTTTINDNDFAEWNLVQGPMDDVDEGDSQTYTFSLTGDGSGTGPFLFQAGETATVDVQVDAMDTTIGDDYPSPVQAIFDAVAFWNSAAGPGNNGANGVLTATFDNMATNAPVVLTYEAGDMAGVNAGDPRTGNPTAMPSLDVVLQATDDSDIEGPEDVSILIENAGSTTGADVRLLGDTMAMPVTDITVTTTINDNDTANFTLTQLSASVDEGESAVYTLTLDGTDGAMPTGDAAVQAGDSASIDLSLTLDRSMSPTTLADFAESLENAVMDAVTAYNNGAVAGDNNTFEFTAQTVTVVNAGLPTEITTVELTITYTGDGMETAPALTIDLNTFEDDGVSQSGHLANLVEPDEDFQISISNPQFNMATGPEVTANGPNTLTTTIIDDDSAEVTIVRVQDAIEGNDTDLTNEARINGLFNVLLSNPSQNEVIVDLSPFIPQGTASPGADFQGTFNSVSFAPSTTFAVQVAPVTVDVVDDMIVEGTETVIATLFDLAVDPDNASGATLDAGDITIALPSMTDPDNQATLDIIDDDMATLTVGDATVNEDAGVVEISVVLDKTVQGSFSVPYTLDGRHRDQCWVRC